LDNSQRTTIILLAGGLARRLPGKLALPVEGEPLLVSTYRRLTHHGARECLISVRSPLPAELTALIPARAIEDRYPDGGPLGGLLSAAHEVRTPLFFAAAGDLPRIDARFIDRLEQRYDACAAEQRAKPAAVIPRHADGRLEPLAALYDTTEFICGARAALERGERKVTAAIAGLHVAYVDLSDAEMRQLANINTPQDWLQFQT